MGGIITIGSTKGDESGLTAHFGIFSKRNDEITGASKGVECSGTE